MNSRALVFFTAIALVHCGPSEDAPSNADPDAGNTADATPAADGAAPDGAKLPDAGGSDAGTPPQTQLGKRLGVPTPDFGIDEVAGATTLTVANGAKMPNTLAAGTVVEIQGTYAANHTSPNTVTCQGTAQKPVFIRGAAGAKVTGSWEISGTYCIVEKLAFAGPGWTVLAPADHIAVRHNDVSGTLSGGGGFGIQTWSAANTTNIVFLDNVIHDNGDWKINVDQDTHGTGVYRSSSATGQIHHVWILDSEYFHNSGDGIQINGNGTSGRTNLHHVWVNGNKFHENKQTGAWTKQASDIVFSQNESYLHRPSDSSGGAGLGGQYGPERVWFLGNLVHDCDNGIQIASDSDNVSVSHYFVGNVIYGIHQKSFNPNTGYSSAALSIWGGTKRTIVNNTIYDVDSGIRSPNGGSWVISNNVIAKVLPAGHHVFLEGQTSSYAATKNLYDENARTVGAGACTGCIVGPPGFVSASAADFGLTAQSAAVDAGTLDPVYAAFKTQYGLDIALDLSGTARPQGTAVDIGALERK